MDIYSVDTLPKYVELYPSCYIANADESTDDGEHWVCVCFDSNHNTEFFCSFGNNPHCDERMVLFMAKKKLLCLEM